MNKGTEVMLEILSIKCYCRKEKLSGCLFCNDCYIKLPVYIRNGIEKDLSRISKLSLEAIRYLSK